MPQWHRSDTKWYVPQSKRSRYDYLDILHITCYILLHYGVLHHDLRLFVLIFILTWWRHQMETFPRYWPFVRGIHRPSVNSPHKGQWRGALMFSFICARINGWANNGDAGDWRHHRTHYDVTVIILGQLSWTDTGLVDCFVEQIIRPISLNPQCTCSIYHNASHRIEMRSILNYALWDIKHVHCGIC